MNNLARIGQWMSLARKFVETCVAEITQYEAEFDTISSQAICEWRRNDPKSLTVTVPHGSGWHTLDHPVQERLYRHGIPFNGPSEGFFGGKFAVSSAGTPVRWVYAYPLQSGSGVVGAILFYSECPFTDSQREAIELMGQLFDGDARLFPASRDVSPITRVMMAEDRLRQEIANNLHGPIQTKLLLVWHSMKRLQKNLGHMSAGQIGEVLDHIAADVEIVREKDIRTLSHRIHPALTRIALRPALEQLAVQFHEPLQIAVEFDPTLARYDSPFENRIPEKVRLAVYRVVEEALANAVRHGRASRAKIKVGIKHGWLLKLSVVDDGIGFHPQAEGLGLTLMRMRVGAVRGRLRIGSGDDAGTIVDVGIPLPKCYRVSPYKPLPGTERRIRAVHLGRNASRSIVVSS